MKIGIDLGGSHIAIGIIDFNSKDLIIEKVEKRLLKEEKENIRESIENYIIENVSLFKDKYDLTEIGIAIPGTVNEKEIIKSVNLDVFDYKIVNILEQSIKLPIKIRNDAKAAALAEYKYGCLQKYSRNLFFTLGTGIGGAVIIDGKLLNTGNLPGCEFGHMIIHKNGKECNCGNKGCFEKYASMKMLKNNLRLELGLEETTRGQVLLDMMRKEKENQIINQVVEEFIDDLCIGISNLVNIFEPEAIGIGGSFVYFSDVLLDKIKLRLNNYLFNKREETIILPAVLGNDAGIIGSVI